MMKMKGMNLFIFSCFFVLLVFDPWVFLFGLMVNFYFYAFSIFYFFSKASFFTFFSSVSYSFGGDLLSMCFIFLTIWIILLMLMASFSVYSTFNYSGELILVCVLLLFFLTASFSSSNMLMFYIFFESSLIPTLFLIFGWGYQPERVSAGYLLFYTLFASLPLLIGILYCYNYCYTLFYFLMSVDVGFYLYLSLIGAFLVKMPMVFFHFGLPKAHVEAPVSGSMVLAGILLKLGGYGLMRVFSFIDGNVFSFNDFFVSLSLFGLLLVGLVCLVQTDIKSLIAYSSVGHMGLVICGIFTLNTWGMYGALVIMIGHGLCSSALFCLANISYERLGSRSLYINKGLITVMPSMSFFWFLLSANNMACPPSLNLLGEIMVINSVMGWSKLSFLFLAFGSFFSCCYSIYLYSVTQHGDLYGGVRSFSSGCIPEFLLIFFYWLPLNFLILSVDIFSIWF